MNGVKTAHNVNFGCEVHGPTQGLMKKTSPPQKPKLPPPTREWLEKRSSEWPPATADKFLLYEELAALQQEVLHLRKKEREDAELIEKLQGQLANRAAYTGSETEETAATQTRARGETRGIDGMNNALWRMGALKHKPPTFRYFDPTYEEQRATQMKEVKLPRAGETHEVCYEPVTRCVFVSQMSNSVLVRIPVGADGMLLDDQDAWRVGPAHPKTGDGISGLHNISRSPANPGCLWLTLQFSNTLVLLDAATMGVRQMIRVPQLMTRADGTVLRVGGPHCIVECPKSGHIWVALKGSVPCHPGMQGSSTGSLAAAITRICCNPEAIKERMAAAAAAAEGAEAGTGGDGGGSVLEALEEGFALWRLDPAKYDPKETATFGGTLYETRPSPPMMAIEPSTCDCWAVQDRCPSSSVVRVGAATGEIEQIPVPIVDEDTVNGHLLKMTGPAIAAAPDGSVWATLLGCDGGLVRFDPKTGLKQMYQLRSEMIPWMTSSRFIHMRFAKLPSAWMIYNNRRLEFPDGLHGLYVISSNLVEDQAINCLTCIWFNPYVGDGWTAPIMRKDIPLPTQMCCCHRIEIVSDGPDDERISAVISELSSARLFQIKLSNIEIYDLMSETVCERTTACGRRYEVFTYDYNGGANSKNAAAVLAQGRFRATMNAFNKYTAAFPGDGKEAIFCPSIADVEAGRQFEDAAQQEAFDEVATSFRNLNPAWLRDGRPSASEPGAPFQPEACAWAPKGKSADAGPTPEPVAAPPPAAAQPEPDSSPQGATDTPSRTLTFEEAAAKVRTLPKGQLSNSQMLELYGLFKQAGGGLASETAQPSRINVQARAKWDAWNAVASLPADDARAKYCSLVDRYTSA